MASGLKSSEEPEFSDDGKPMRSFVPRRNQKNEPPQAEYEKGEKAYLYYDPPRKGHFIVYVASDGVWNADKQDIMYKLKVGNEAGELYKNGELIGEKQLMASAPSSGCG
ncbi:hypothetical protein BP5796_02834 [Coleophoma crateriformis]|uniref:Uncharacterized protein n=1 Tax=Coleophoma crateriformis TaxID=565419 RepID=A0A3D8SZJ7_9HELO|nr:hypothetical protein BP5796_02834 [Coleophoma crateriformis]